MTKGIGLRIQCSTRFKVQQIIQQTSLYCKWINSFYIATASTAFIKYPENKLKDLSPQKVISTFQYYRKISKNTEKH